MFQKKVKETTQTKKTETQKMISGQEGGERKYTHAVLLCDEVVGF